MLLPQWLTLSPVLQRVGGNTFTIQGILQDMEQFQNPRITLVIALTAVDGPRG